MANPNIVNVTSIYGESIAQAMTTTLTTVIMTVSADVILKVNSISATNTHASNATDFSLTITKAGFTSAGVASDDDDFITGIGNWLFTTLFNILFRQKTTDYLVMYRAFHKELVQELGISHQSISWQSQLMCRAAKSNKKIGEIPGDEPARIGGVRKMKPFHNGLAELRMLASERFFQY